MLVYLSFNFDFYVSKINAFMSSESSTQTKQLNV